MLDFQYHEKQIQNNHRAVYAIDRISGHIQEKQKYMTRKPYSFQIMALGAWGTKLQDLGFSEHVLLLSNHSWFGVAEACSIRIDELTISLHSYTAHSW